MTADLGAGADLDVVEVALSVLARKLRAELMLGLLEALADGRRSGRSVLAEFELAEAAVAGERPGITGRASRGLRELFGRGTPDVAPGRWSASVRRALTGGPPEWERLRQVGRDRGRPVPEWEIFYGLSKLAAGRGGSGGPGRRGGREEFTLETIEAEMDLASGLGETWSLHQYLREARQRCGPGFRPGRPEEVAATLLRVDASRQLAKPGGFTVGIRPGPTATSARSIDEKTMRDLAQNLQEATSQRMAASAGLDLLRSGAAGTNGQRPFDSDISQAMRAGSAIVRERRAHAAALRARERADELRGTRLASSSTALFVTGAATGVALTIAGLSTGTRAQLTTSIGVLMTTMSLAGNAIKDWRPNSEAMTAPLRAWVAERVAELSHRAAEREVERLHRGSAAMQAVTVWGRARAAMQGTRDAALEGAVRRMEKPEDSEVVGKSTAQPLAAAPQGQRR
ncbi:hypothetical protein [Pseudonocardia sp. WMMC193]|uniref:hypothetical protein n=1 Tax=Pseudonocardia sp. WMMC193 TaxID=2911965 RepID=UPI001F2BF9F8|nr:hypothetical protein [Pseudonocardia sp. WMMC193]MCF7547165.1 hypothetical protein [Pseudonocardia sp. WMMC193]MCF7547259.1 hypothetical protein [Pseudonocardia sp. WMMC193]